MISLPMTMKCNARNIWVNETKFRVIISLKIQYIVRFVLLEINYISIDDIKIIIIFEVLMYLNSQK